MEIDSEQGGRVSFMERQKLQQTKGGVQVCNALTAVIDLTGILMY